MRLRPKGGTISVHNRPQTSLTARTYFHSLSLALYVVFPHSFQPPFPSNFFFSSLSSFFLLLSFFPLLPSPVRKVTGSPELIEGPSFWCDLFPTFPPQGFKIIYTFTNFKWVDLLLLDGSRRFLCHIYIYTYMILC